MRSHQLPAASDRTRPVPTALVICASVVLILQYMHWQGFDIAAYADAATVFLYTILALVFVLAACVYVALSRLLVLLLGSFPPVVRPLRPLRRGCRDDGGECLP